MLSPPKPPPNIYVYGSCANMTAAPARLSEYYNVIIGGFTRLKLHYILVLTHIRLYTDKNCIL